MLYKIIDKDDYIMTNEQLQNENLTLKRVIAKLSQKVADQEIDLTLAAVQLEDSMQTINQLNAIIADGLQQNDEQN